MPGVFKIKNVEDAEFTLTHPDGAGAVSIDSNNIAKIDAVNAALALKANTADLKEIGVNQTIQTFTVGTQRIAGTTYTNSSGKPIEIYINGSSGGGSWNITLTINGTQALFMGVTSNQGEGLCFSGIIPNGATYVVGNSGASISSWKELR